MSDFWMIDPDTRGLVTPYQNHPKAEPIVGAKPFTVSVVSLVVAKDLDGFLRGKNDILVLTRASLGDQPRVERVHFYEEEVEKSKPIRNLFASLMYLSDDYSGTDRLWLELDVMEIDTDTGERKAAVQAFEAMAATAGAVFPAAIPYGMAASAVLKVAEKLVSALEDDEKVVRVPVAFHPGKARPGRAPFQSGTFVAFSREIAEPGKYVLKPDGTLTANGKAPDVSYIVFDVVPEAVPRPSFVTSQKVATLLTQLRDKNRNSMRSTVEFVTDTVEAYANFQKLNRYVELKQKGSDASQEELDLIKKIEAIDALRPFLPQG